MAELGDDMLKRIERNGGENAEKARFQVIGVGKLTEEEHLGTHGHREAQEKVQQCEQMAQWQSALQEQGGESIVGPTEF